MAFVGFVLRRQQDDDPKTTKTTLAKPACMVQIQPTRLQKQPRISKTTMILAIPTTIVVSAWVFGNWFPFWPGQTSAPPPTIAEKTVLLQPLKPPDCEGYWPETEICLELGTTVPDASKRTPENADCPQWKMNAAGWPEQEQITSKLGEIESIAKEWEKLLQGITSEQFARCGGEEGVKPPVWISRQRGLAWSRIEENAMAGNSEYHTDDGDCWTDALLPMYMQQFNVEPSDKFKAFVNEFDVPGFRRALVDLKRRMGPA